MSAEAFEARALQHEIDHCEGLQFLDRVAGAHAITRARPIFEFAPRRAVLTAAPALVSQWQRKRS